MKFNKVCVPSILIFVLKF